MISWAADQVWSTGKIGLSGISYLGSNQVSHSFKVTHESKINLDADLSCSGRQPHEDLEVLLQSAHGRDSAISIVKPLDVAVLLLLWEINANLGFGHATDKCI
jgi:X-Pro dipeptidyl-peptidase (S15 family)